MRNFFRWLENLGRKFMAWRWYWRLLALTAAVFLLVFVSNYVRNIWAFWDDDPDRGATIVQTDVYGDVANKIVFLDQAWQAKDTLWYDSVTQGSDLIPYDFFLVLERPNGALFRDNENMNNKYRYLVRKPTYSNPDGLPVGIVKDNYQGKDFMGFTCAACHTNQVNYKGVGIRIDGGPAMADMDTMLTDLAADLWRANDGKKNPGLQARFVKNVLALGHYGSEQDVLADLDKYAVRLQTYRIVNRSDTTYGYARLDAFGRIYNQVLQYVLTVADLDAAKAELINQGKLTNADLDRCGFNAVLDSMRKKHVLDGNDRDALLATMVKLAGEGFGGLKKVLYFRNTVFNPPNAPVSYPFVWDIPQHDYVQWNGIASNAGLGPMGRNVGEVVGVFGTMNWSRSDHWTVAGVFSGQGLFNGHPIDYFSSVNVHNIALIEDKLKSLQRPAWPQNYLGKIDWDKAWRGKALFERYCAACHAEIDPTDPNRRIVAHFSAQDRIKTDDMMAKNSVGYEGYSGIVRNTYVTVGAGPLLLNKKAPVAALLTKTVTGVVATPDADKWWPQRFAEWLYDVIFSLRNNNISPSLKNGDYHPDTSAEPIASDVSYKGRALDGIWATAPYLHNGSVPTLYDLLLPAEQRPASFQVGSREFDPHKVGFKPAGYQGFTFLTSKMGNSNAGHEYGTHDTTGADGKPLPALTEAERWDLVEYLKSQ